MPPCSPDLLSRPARLGLALLSGALLFGAVLFPGCKSASEQRTDADRESYELVASRRAKLGLGGEGFTLEPSPDSLRQRILRGEVQRADSLTLEEILNIAADNSRDFQSRKERLYLSALDLTLFHWQFSTQSTLDGTIFLDGQGSEATLAGANGNFGLSKLLGSGAKIISDVGLSFARALTFGDGWHPTSNMHLNVTQPLLRGFGGDIVKEPLTQAERNLVYEARSYERFRRTFAVDTANRYWRLLQTMTQVTNQEANYKSLQALSARNASLAEAGRLSDIELGQAKQDELSSRNNLIDARARLDRALDDFKLFLGLPMSFEMSVDPGVVDELAGQQNAPDLDETAVLPYALRNRLDHMNVLDEFEDARRKVTVAEDALRAGLDLEVDAKVFSKDGKPATYNFQDTSWGAVLTWDLPIDKLPTRNVYRRTLVEVQASARACESSADTITAELRDDLRNTRSRRESYQIQLNAVDLAERRIESTRLKRDAGRASTRDLLEAEDALLSAKNAANSALIDYTLSRLSVWLDLEILRVDEHGIHAEEQLLLQADAGGGAAKQEAGG